MKPDASTRQSPAWLRFFKHESAGGMLLALAAAAALAVSNSPWRAGYEALVQAPVEIRLGTWLTLAKPAVVWVNDLWMAVFFLLVGLGACRALGRACAGASFGASLGVGEAWDWPPQRADNDGWHRKSPRPFGLKLERG